MGRSAAVALIAALLLASSIPAQDQGPPAPKPADRTSLRVLRARLPVLGTVGDLPAEGERVVVELLPRPLIHVGPEFPDVAGLRRILAERSDAFRDKPGAGLSRLHVVLRVDRDACWLDVQGVLRACADPAVGLHRILFAAVPEGGGEEGALALFLPVPAPEGGPAPSPGGYRLPLKLEEVSGTKTRPAAGALSILHRIPAARVPEVGGVSIEAGPHVSTGAVLEVVDTALRWGAKEIRLDLGSNLDSLADAARRSVADPRPLVSAPPLGAPWPGKSPGALPPVARVTGRMAGQATSPVDAPEVLSPGTGGAIGIGGGAGGLFGERRRNGRAALAREGGQETAQPVEWALDWLARHQSADGRWDSDGFAARCQGDRCDGPGGSLFDPGLTGLALLAFQAADETHRTFRYGPVVRAGVKWLMAIQDGEGCFGPRTSGHFTYNHAIAALALADLYGMTQSPLFRPSAQNGVHFVATCRNPYLAWRYGVKPEDNDTSVSAWMVQALHVAHAAGLEVDPDCFEGARAFLGKVTEPKYGRVGYTASGNGPARPEEFQKQFPLDRSESITAAGVYTLLCCGVPASEPLLRKGIGLCIECFPSAEPGCCDYYYWYYGTNAMFQVGGESWQTWNGKLKKVLLDSQRKDPASDRRGSWDPADPWQTDGGRIYSTAINTLTLQTYYRYARFAKR